MIFSDSNLLLNLKNVFIEEMGRWLIAKSVNRKRTEMTLFNAERKMQVHVIDGTLSVE